MQISNKNPSSHSRIMQYIILLAAAITLASSSSSNTIINKHDEVSSSWDDVSPN